MADHWQQFHRTPAEHLNDLGLENAAYVASWVLSCAAVLGVILLVWHFHI